MPTETVLLGGASFEISNEMSEEVLLTRYAHNDNPSRSTIVFDLYHDEGTYNAYCTITQGYDYGVFDINYSIKHAAYAQCEIDVRISINDVLAYPINSSNMGQEFISDCIDTAKAWSKCFVDYLLSRGSW